MKTTAQLILAATALLSAPAFATEDPVLASFERDLHREPVTQTARAVFVEEDPLHEAFHVAVYGARKPAIHAASGLGTPGDAGNAG